MALDLPRDVPRSPFAELGGYAWLPRLVDKARAGFAGTKGEYSAYPCGGDRRFLAHFALDAEALGELIKGGASDEAITAWVAANAKGDQGAYRDELAKPYANPLLRLAVWVFRKKTERETRGKRPDVRWGDLKTFAMVIAAEEGHPIP